MTVPFSESNKQFSPVRSGIAIGIILLLTSFAALGRPEQEPGEGERGPDRYNVVWDSPSANSTGSMPIGNGDIGLNVWVERRKGDPQRADLLFYIAKSDTVSENSQLLKLGRVRVGLDPDPFAEGSSFRQELRLQEGEIVISAGDGARAKQIRIWVDANHPEIHLEAAGAEPFSLQARVELWRTSPRTVVSGSREHVEGLYELEGSPLPVVIDPDTVLAPRDNRLVWLHRNERSIYPDVLKVQHLAALLDKYPDPLLHRTFGCLMRGPGLVSVDNLTLKSTEPATSQRLSIAVHLARTPTIDAWREQLEEVASADDALALEAARAAHAGWWREFWDRSWIDVAGPGQADAVARGYALQRWMVACSGRGGLPLKFNGSIFTVGTSLPDPSDPSKSVDVPEYRNWGNCYWFQNGRLIYWPLLATGDYDILAPWFKMYSDALPLAIDKTRLYYQHGGAYFPETMSFWGLPNNANFGWKNEGVETVNSFIKRYWQGGIEMTAMMLDRYDYTNDREFAVHTLVPFADAIATFYDEHWQRAADGKILFDPAQSLETWHSAVNPLPEIASLMYVLPRLQTLPVDLTTPEQRQRWGKLLTDLPPLPIGAAADGTRALLPAEKITSPPSNSENTELYAVFPFRLYGVGKPDLELARHTYEIRRTKQTGCWYQDAIDAALLGFANEASRDVAINFTRSDARFPAFWKENPDWTPDMDNGGVGMQALQFMLMQCDGRRIELLPAWPAGWDVDFKLHAPLQTTVEGSVKSGQLTRLVVKPDARGADVEVAEGWRDISRRAPQ